MQMEAEKTKQSYQTNAETLDVAELIICQILKELTGELSYTRDRGRQLKWINTEFFHW